MCPLTLTLTYAPCLKYPDFLEWCVQLPVGSICLLWRFCSFHVWKLDALHRCLWSQCSFLIGVAFLLQCVNCQESFCFAAQNYWHFSGDFSHIIGAFWKGEVLKAMCRTADTVAAGQCCTLQRVNSCAWGQWSPISSNFRFLSTTVRTQWVPAGGNMGSKIS